MENKDCIVLLSDDDSDVVIAEVRPTNAPRTMTPRGTAAAARAGPSLIIDLTMPQHPSWASAQTTAMPHTPCSPHKPAAFPLPGTLVQSCNPKRTGPKQSETLAHAFGDTHIRPSMPHSSPPSTSAGPATAVAATRTAAAGTAGEAVPAAATAATAAAAATAGEAVPAAAAVATVPPAATAAQHSAPNGLDTCIAISNPSSLKRGAADSAAAGTPSPTSALKRACNSSSYPSFIAVPALSTDSSAGTAPTSACGMSGGKSKVQQLHVSCTAHAASQGASQQQLQQPNTAVATASLLTLPQVASNACVTQPHAAPQSAMQVPQMSNRSSLQQPQPQQSTGEQACPKRAAQQPARPRPSLHGVADLLRQSLAQLLQATQTPLHGTVPEERQQQQQPLQKQQQLQLQQQQQQLPQATLCSDMTPLLVAHYVPQGTVQQPQNPQQQPAAHVGTDTSPAVTPFHTAVCCPRPVAAEVKSACPQGCPTAASAPSPLQGHAAAAALSCKHPAAAAAGLVPPCNVPRADAAGPAAPACPFAMEITPAAIRTACGSAPASPAATSAAPAEPSRELSSTYFSPCDSPTAPAGHHTASCRAPASPTNNCVHAKACKESSIAPASLAGPSYAHAATHPSADPTPGRKAPMWHRKLLQDRDKYLGCSDHMSGDRRCTVKQHSAATRAGSVGHLKQGRGSLVMRGRGKGRGRGRGRGRVGAGNSAVVEVRPSDSSSSSTSGTDSECDTGTPIKSQDSSKEACTASAMRNNMANSKGPVTRTPAATQSSQTQLAILTLDTLYGPPRRMLGMWLHPDAAACFDVLLASMVRQLQDGQEQPTPANCMDQLVNSVLVLSNDQQGISRVANKKIKMPFARAMRRGAAQLLGRPQKELTAVQVLQHLPEILPMAELLTPYTVAEDDEREGLRGQQGVCFARDRSPHNLLQVYAGYAMWESDGGYRTFPEWPACKLLLSCWQALNQLAQQAGSHHLVDLLGHGEVSARLAAIRYLDSSMAEQLLTALLAVCKLSTTPQQPQTVKQLRRQVAHQRTIGRTEGPWLCAAGPASVLAGVVWGVLQQHLDTLPLAGSVAQCWEALSLEQRCSLPVVTLRVEVETERWRLQCDRYAADAKATSTRAALLAAGLTEADVDSVDGVTAQVVATALPPYSNNSALANDPMRHPPIDDLSLREYPKQAQTAQCDMREVWVAGWPIQVMVTNRQVKQGEPVWYSYGNEYWKLIKGQEANMAATERRIAAELKLMLLGDP